MDKLTFEQISASPELRDAYTQGVNAGSEHSKSSPETLKLFENMQRQLDYLVKMMEESRETNDKQHEEMIEHQKHTNGSVKRNTEFRLKHEELMSEIKETVAFAIETKGGLKTLKWLASFMGFGNIVMMIYLFITHAM